MTQSGFSRKDLAVILKIPVVLGFIFFLPE